MAFRVGRIVTNDLADLARALVTRPPLPVQWYTRAQMQFMQAATGEQWTRFAEGPALTLSER